MSVIELTPAEVPVWRDVPEGGTFLLVRKGESYDVRDYPAAVAALGETANYPPAVFVEACAPCPGVPPEDPRACGGAASFGLNNECVHCRIELVGLCPTCRGWTRCEGDDKRCPSCDQSGTVPLGHAYAVSQPLLLMPWGPDDAALVKPLSKEVVTFYSDEPALAHYGPPESLVGKWAVELRRA